MVTITIGKHSSAYGKIVWKSGDTACIRIGDRLLKGKVVHPFSPKLS